MKQWVAVSLPGYPQGQASEEEEDAATEDMATGWPSDHSHTVFQHEMHAE